VEMEDKFITNNVFSLCKTKIMCPQTVKFYDIYKYGTHPK